MVNELLIEVLYLLAEAEIGYTGNGVRYDPEIMDELQNISERVHTLMDKIEIELPKPKSNHDEIKKRKVSIGAPFIYITSYLNS